MSNFSSTRPYTPPQITQKQLSEVQEGIRPELLDARVAIAQLNGFIKGVPSSTQALLNPIYLQEALASSEIENINTTLIEVMQRLISPSPKQDNSTLVVNYFNATLWGLKMIDQGLSSRLIRGLQRHLLPHDADEGFRRQQVVIADGRGSVRYTPPIASAIPRLIADWERLVNDGLIVSLVDPLVIAAAAHYQFEAIHPFSDGNGRTGRILMTLHLVHAGLIDTPSIHVSQFINANRPQYYRLLLETSRTQNYTPLTQFMVKGFAKQARHSFDLLQKIQIMQLSWHEDIKAALPKVYRHDLVDKLFEFPVVTPVALGKQLGCHYATASKYLHELKAKGYLKSARVGRNAYFVNYRLLDAVSAEGRMR
jgi:Fic family protein